ncbi:MAG: Clp protease N-terminal domain-containing protein [Gaiellaceae bacterium]
MTDSVVDLARRAAELADSQSALAAITELRLRLGELEEYHVETALARGASWTEIGRALGVSKQAAHKRFATRTGRPSGRAGRRVTVTGTARAAVQLARSEAAAAGRRLLAPEHLLLGLLDVPGGSAAGLLADLGVTLEAARTVLGGGRGELLETGEVEVSARSRVVLERALDEALRLGDDELRDVHVLLAVVRHGGVNVRRALDALGVEPASVLVAAAGRNVRPPA